MKRSSVARAALVAGAIAGVTWLADCAADVVPTESAPKSGTSGSSNTTAGSGGGTSGTTSTMSTGASATSGVGGNAPTCSDNVKNNGETDVDCGGKNCPLAGCALGKHCAVDGDCVGSGQCQSGVCTPNLVGVWTQIPVVAPKAPSGRYDTAMVYDRLHKKSLLVGGQQQATASLVLDSMWSWDGTAWTQVNSPASPPPRAAPVLIYDSDRDRALLYGGAEAAGVPSNAMVEWSGAAWNPIALSPAPAARYSAGAAYDAGHKVVLVEGGYGAGDTVLLDLAGQTYDTLDLDGGASPGMREYQSAIYDVGLGKVVLFGGYNSGNPVGDTWIWDGAAWTSASPASAPAARYAPGFVYDDARRRGVLFGGFLGSAYSNETWEWDGANWTQITTDPNSTPPARSQSGMAFDTDRRRVALFGGNDGTDRGDTWEYYAIANACQTDKDCDTNHCVDGLCCADASCGTCEACNTEANPGHCAPVLGAKDASCAGTCDDAGACMP